MDSLKMAFRDEVRPNDFMGRVWLTAIVVWLALSGMAICPDGSRVVIGNVVPMGDWHPLNPSGQLYVEVWSTILVNANQIAFGLWGGVLLLMGVKRLVTGNKYVFGCFFLGIAFIGIACALPSCVQAILQIVVQKFPALMQ